MCSQSIGVLNPYVVLKKRKKRKFPKIIIWDVSLTHKSSKDIFASFYFLSYKKAVKFIDKNISAWHNDYIVHLDGGYLWL